MTPPRPPGVLPNGNNPPASIDLLDNLDAAVQTTVNPPFAESLNHQASPAIVIPAGNPAARAYVDPFWTLPAAADGR